MSKASELFPDVHYKMSKKIAQLTKVIYQLNSKNEDHQVDLQHQQTNHTQEIQLILRDAAAKISKFKDALESKQQQINDQAYIDKLTKKFEVEKQKAIQDLSAYKSLVAENEDKLSRSYQSKFSSLKRQVESMTEQFDTRVSAFESAFAELKRKADEERSKLKSKFDSEKSAGLAAANKKYEDAMNDNLKSRHMLEADLDKRNTEAQDKLRAELTHQMEQQLGMLRAQLGGDKQESLIHLRRELEEQMQKQRSQLTDEVEKALKESRLKSSELEALQKELHRTEASLKARVEELQRHSEQQAGDMDSNMRALMTEVAQAREEAFQRAAQVVEQTEEIARLSRLLSLNSTKTADLEKSLATSVAELAESRDKLRTLQRLSESRESALSSEVSSLKSHIQSLETEIAGLREEMVVYKSDAVRARDAYAEEKRRLEESLRRKESELDAALTSTAAADARAEMLQAMSDREAQLSEERARSEAALKEQYSKELTELQRSAEAVSAQHEAEKVAWKDELENLRAEHHTALRDMQHRIETTASSGEQASAELTLRLEAASQEIGSLKDQLSAQMALSHSEIASLQSKLSTSRTECEEANARLEAARVRIASLEKDISDFKGELVNRSSTFEEQLVTVRSKLEAEWNDKLRQLRGTHAKDMEALKSEHSSSTALAMKQLRDGHSQHTDQLNNQMSELKDSLAALTTSMQEERAAFQRQLRDALGSQSDLRAEFDLSLARERESAASNLATELSLLREGLLQEAVDKEKAMKAGFELDMANLHRQHEGIVSETRSVDGRRLSVALKEHDDASAAVLQKAREDLLEVHAKEMRAVELRHQNALKDKQKVSDEAVANLQSQLNDVTQRFDTSEFRRNELMQLLTSARSEMEAAVMSHGAAMRAAKEDLEARLIKERESNDRARNELSAALQSELANLKASHATTVNLLEEQRARLLDQNATLEIRWANRDSRPEDIERIHALQEEVAEKSQLLQKTKDEMMYFKREMINREESYNTKFNVSPVVGVMNVVKGTKDVTKKPPRQQTQAQQENNPVVRRSSLTTHATVGMAPSLGLSSGDDSATVKSRTMLK